MANNNNREGNALFRVLMRGIGVIAVLWLTSFLTPGFSIRGMWSFILAAIAITGLDYGFELLMDYNASPLGKGLKGFILSAIIIYLAQYLVPAMNVSIIGAVLAALVIGILDMVFPVKVM